MLRLALVLMLFLAGCGPRDGDSDAAEEEAVPIGPGSDSTTLIPPDTPMTSREPAPAGRTTPDSLAPTTTR